MLLIIDGNSFSAEMLVMTDEGLVAISEIEVGDLVLAYDEETGDVGYYEVAHTWAHLDSEILYRTIDGGSNWGRIFCSCNVVVGVPPYHPVSMTIHHSTAIISLGKKNGRVTRPLDRFQFNMGENHARCGTHC